MARLLIVDDEPQLLNFYRGYFQRLKFDVLLATSVAEAVALHRVRRPDLIVADACMRDGGVLELLRIVGRESPVLVNTGSDAISLAAMAKHLGAVDVVQKADGPAALLRAIRCVLPASD
jgi:DNA-binding NtrC family response regulator